jgi:hypothetical protein
MPRSVTVFAGGALLLVGYLLGASQALHLGSLWAQGSKGADSKKPAVEISDDAQAKIKVAADALKAAADALQNDSRYEPAIKGINTFAVLSGGGNAVKDLESGAIVDPETYAALYADLATDAVAAHLGRDAEGHLTYKNKRIRVYPVGELQRRYSIRAELTGEELAAGTGDAGDDAKPPKGKVEDE